MSARSPVLQVSGLSVSFEVDGPVGRDVVAAVDDVSFTLEESKVLAVVGESGSGKSVTAMSALGLLPATARVSGSVTLGGDELVGAGEAMLREVRGGRIGTVFQEPMSAFNPVFNVGNQIAEALWAHGHTNAVRERGHELLRQAGLSDPARVWSAYPHQLSGGQLQRAMIAMAISCEPTVLIADEPTTALDVTVQADMLDLLRDLRDRLGTAILLITHDMGVVADLADDVVVLRAGEVVERAPVDRLFAEPDEAYTRDLLAAVPTLSEPRSAPLSAGEAAPEPTYRADVADESAAALSGAVVEFRGRRGARVRAVDEVDLSIRPGETLGLVGESGSGKTTVGRVLAGLVGVNAGRVSVAGTEMIGASRRRWRTARRRLGMVFQDPASSLNPRHSVGASVAEPLTVHTATRGPDLANRVAALLSAVHLPTGTEVRYPHELSGGQRQRVAIARAIALDPSLLIADEPTSALDVSVQAHILDLFSELRERLGFGCLFISHDLAVVERLVDRVAVMQSGRVVEQGPAADVLGSPRHSYTQLLLAAAPVLADPAAQRDRRETRRRLIA